MDYIWGKVNHRLEIIESINQYYSVMNLKPSNFSFKHIKSGFTDNVFLATFYFNDQNKSQSLIIKEYLKDWHQKEINVYQDILQSNEFLGSPKLIIHHQNFLILEYLSPDNTYAITSQNVSKLKDWLSAKHNFFKGKTYVEKFNEKENIQINYLIEKPLLTIPKILGDSKTTRTILNYRDVFITNLKIDRQLPQTLEHGDLEPQNLFIDNNNKLRVIDWVNTRKGSGLFDINQYFETADELNVDLDINQSIKEISEEINFSDLMTFLPKIRQLMLLNKINFYGEKLLNGEVESYSKHKPIKQLLEKYVAELVDNIEKNN